MAQKERVPNRFWNSFVSVELINPSMVSQVDHSWNSLYPGLIKIYDAMREFSYENINLHII